MNLASSVKEDHKLQGLTPMSLTLCAQILNMMVEEVKLPLA